MKLVDEDKKLLNIELNDKETSFFSKWKYKKMIKQALNKAVFKHLLQLKEGHSKMNELNYSCFAKQDYLKSNNGLSYDEKCTLFKFRVREIDVRTNYRNKYNNITKCQLCESEEEETQIHLFNCKKLQDNCEALANNINIEYEDIFNDILKQVAAAKLLFKIMETRTKLIEDG